MSELDSIRRVLLEQQLKVRMRAHSRLDYSFDRSTYFRAIFSLPTYLHSFIIFFGGSSVRIIMAGILKWFHRSGETQFSQSRVRFL